MVAWYVAPYVRSEIAPDRIARRCVVDDLSATIEAAGGSWQEVEVLGDRAIVRVEAPSEVLDQVASLTAVRRLPATRLEDSLSTLPAGQRSAIRAELEDAGYGLDEIRSRLGDDLATVTLRDVLRFLATRRRRPRMAGGEIVLDGDELTCDTSALKEVLS